MTLTAEQMNYLKQTVTIFNDVHNLQEDGNEIDDFHKWLYDQIKTFRCSIYFGEDGKETNRLAHKRRVLLQFIAVKMTPLCFEKIWR